MESARIKKAAVIILTACGIILSFFSESFAAAAWLSAITNTDTPGRIALDAQNNLYVTEGRGRNRVVVFDRRGTYVRALGGLKNPRSIAVDEKSRLFVGNSGTGSVDVYNSDFSFSHKLGKGDGEFKSPTSIGISGNGLVYVVDHDANAVKVFSLDGKRAFTFGEPGRDSCEFNEPISLAIDDGKGEIYITDLGLIGDPANSNAPMGGARVQVFDLNGGSLRSFGQYGSGPGEMKKPVGIAADGSGTLYITDSFQAAVHVFTSSGTWIETIADNAHVLKAPAGIAVGKDKRLFVASSNGPSIEIYGLSGYSTMEITPAGPLSFTAQEGGPNASSQILTIANSGSGTLNWNATGTTSDGSAWLVSQASGSTAPQEASMLPISVDIVKTALHAGIYDGSVTIKSDSGTEEKRSIQLTVTPPPASLSITPSSLSFKAQLNGPAPQVQSIGIRSSGSGTITWSATATPAWIVLTATPASNPSSLTVSPNTSGMPVGMHSGTITITASGAQETSQSVPVSVQVIQAGTVRITTNNTKAAFDVIGPAVYSGTGREWSSEEVVPGDYRVMFKHISGSFKPATRTFTIQNGQQVAVNGDYRRKPVPTHIIAGSGGKTGKDTKVAILTLDGKTESSFSPFTNPESLRVAAGDLDGSGVDKIVVTDYRRTIKIYTAQWLELATYELPEGYKNADVVVGDIDNDGKADIIVGSENEAPNSDRKQRTIKLLVYSAAGLQEKTTVWAEDKEGSFSFAVGDVNDDGLAEFVVADAGSVRAFSIAQSSGGIALTQLWIKKAAYGNGVQIAVGDINDDGIDEIAVSYEFTRRNRRKQKELSSLVTVLKGTGEDYGLMIEPFKELGFKKAATISLGDINGDGKDEFIIGAGHNESNDSVLRVFSSSGTFGSATIKPMNGKFGVNVGVGTLQ